MGDERERFEADMREAGWIRSLFSGAWIYISQRGMITEQDDDALAHWQATGITPPPF